jgi:hypothetical protein
MHINYEKVKDSKLEPKKFSGLCTFNFMIFQVTVWGKYKQRFQDFVLNSHSHVEKSY